MKIIKGYFEKKYLIYLIRWLISGFVMLPVMLILESYGLTLWLNLMIGQAFGSLIFYEIDKWIFKEHKTDNIEDTIEDIVDYKVEPSVSDRKL